MIARNTKKKLFTSSREKQLWCWVFVVIIAIFSTLFIGKPLANQLRDQDVQAVFFGIGLLMVIASVIVYGIKTPTSRIETFVILGISAVYVLFFFRLGAPERSHLIEFSVLAIFIHKAILERSNQKKLILKPNFSTLILTFFIGVIDESIQIILPNRIFDLQDLIFNGIAATMAIASNTLLAWSKKQFKKLKKEEHHP